MGEHKGPTLPEKDVQNITRQQEKLLDEVALEDFRRIRKLVSVPVVTGPHRDIPQQCTALEEA